MRRTIETKQLYIDQPYYYINNFIDIKPYAVSHIRTTTTTKYPRIWLRFRNRNNPTDWQIVSNRIFECNNVSIALWYDLRLFFSALYHLNHINIDRDVVNPIFFSFKKSNVLIFYYSCCLECLSGYFKQRKYLTDSQNSIRIIFKLMRFMIIAK